MKSKLLKKISKAIKRINKVIFKDIPKHPVASNRKLKSISRYIKNHTGYNDKPGIINWFGGIKYSYQKGDASFSDNYFFGLAEWQESLFLLRYLNASDIFLDIGANHGHYTLLASAISKSKVYAIEPVPATFKQLQNNVKLNNLHNQVTLLNIGFSNEVGSLYFSTDKGTMNKIVDVNYTNKASVPVSTLDEINIKPNIIKIDVEGFEFDVFTGGEKTLELKELNVIICEINFTLKQGISGMDIVNFLQSKKFMPYYYNGNKMIALNDFNHETFNTIFIKNIDLVNSRLATAKQITIWGVNL